jgi:energy-coupling factor transporter ATP-binding protein EcfA2
VKNFLENFIARLWNQTRVQRHRTRVARGLYLGPRLVDGNPTQSRVEIAHNRRAESIALLGKTGSGKSYLLKSLQKQDIQESRGFVAFDLHGDLTPFLLGTIADHEKLVKRNLDDRTIVVEPDDPTMSVGINPLESRNGNSRFIQIAEFTQVLRQRWHLESFGARTDELLRNSLYVLAENSLTLLEVGPLLSHAGFRARCLRNVTNTEVRQYFELRYDSVSEPMRATMREPILNKMSAFTADTHFRHIVGQRTSTFSLIDALDRGYWIILNLHKGKLGDQSATLGSLFLTMIKNALFARNSRNLFTLYCDEIQNLVAYGSGLETMLSEARKFAISIVSANQFLDQYPPEMRAAINAVGTQIFFQLSSSDATQVANALDGGKTLAEILKNLPRRHMVVKTGAERWQQTIVPMLAEPKTDPSDLIARSRARWSRKRSDIEAEVRQRQAISSRKTSEVLHGWE